MSVYRRKYRDRKGEWQTSRYFSFQFQTPDGRLIRGSTRCTNKRAAEAEETRVRTEEEQEGAGVITAKDRNRNINEHIADFIDYLKNTLKRDGEYCYTMEKRLKRLAIEAGWTRLNQISLRSFEAWRNKAAKTPGGPKTPWAGRKPTARTLNQYLDTARRFMNWARKQRRARNNPLIDAEKTLVIDNNDYRRAATVEEFAKILKVLDAKESRFWKFIIYLPLRRRTLESILWGDVHEDADPPWIAVRGEIVKGNKFLRLPLRRELAKMLAEWRAELKPILAANIFPDVPDMDEWRAVLAKAGVDFARGGRHRLDLHAIRRTALKWMQDAGVPVNEAMAMLGHKSEATTRKYYAEAPDPRTIKAVEKMPSLDQTNEINPKE